MKKMTKKGKKGFTLIELVVVIAILGILAAILIPVIGGFIDRANTAADEANARNLYNSVAMALAVGETDVADGEGANQASTEALPVSVAEMFGTVGDGDTWGYNLSGDIVISAQYNDAVYARGN